MFTRAPPAVRVISSHVRARRVVANRLLACVCSPAAVERAMRRDHKSEPEATVESPATAEAIVARIGEQAITSTAARCAVAARAARPGHAEVPAAAPRRSRQRFCANSNARRYTMHSAELLLEPPAPPRVKVEADANRVRPAGATAGDRARVLQLRIAPLRATAGDARAGAAALSRSRSLRRTHAAARLSPARRAGGGGRALRTRAGKLLAFPRRALCRWQHARPAGARACGARVRPRADAHSPSVWTTAVTRKT